MTTKESVESTILNRILKGPRVEAGGKSLSLNQTRLKPRKDLSTKQKSIGYTTASSEDKNQVNKYTPERGENVNATVLLQTCTALLGTSKDLVYISNRLNNATPICHEYHKFRSRLLQCFRLDHPRLLKMCCQMTPATVVFRALIIR